MNGTMNWTIAVAGNVALALFQRWKNRGPGSVGACVLRAAGVVAALLLSAAAPAQQPGESFRDCEYCPEMVMLPAGEFEMGTPALLFPAVLEERIRSLEEIQEETFGKNAKLGEGIEVYLRREYDEAEVPLHLVTIPHPFAVGKYEVTKGEYSAFLQEVPLPVPWGNEAGPFSPLSDGTFDHPVVNVSWDEAKKYVAWLSRETGHEYRLLSESEWEYAARTGTRTAYHWGDSIGLANAHCRSCGSRWDGKEGPVPVGSFFANGFGLHDMHGNVWEWVEDCWNRGYEGAPPDGRAWLSGGCDARVLRGGSWYDHPESLRAATRAWRAAGFRNGHVGFRVARTN